jgi:formyl-CoA transferase
VAPKVSRTPGKIWRGSVTVGHENGVVYRDILGLSDRELEDPRRRRVV